MSGNSGNMPSADLPQSDLQHLVEILNAGQSEKAAAFAQQLIAQFPGIPFLHFALGVALAAQNRHEPAIKSYRTALGLKPDYFDALKSLGMSLLARGDYNQAITCLQEAF